MSVHANNNKEDKRLRRHTSRIPVFFLPVSQRAANHIREIIILQCSQSKKSLQQLWETRRSRVIEHVVNEDDGPLKGGYTRRWAVFLNRVIVLGKIDLSMCDSLEKSQPVIEEKRNESAKLTTRSDCSPY